MRSVGALGCLKIRLIVLEFNCKLQFLEVLVNFVLVFKNEIIIYFTNASKTHLFQQKTCSCLSFFFFFYFSRIDTVHNIFCINIIKYAEEGFLFRYTDNHTADSNEGCLKTVDVFTCSSIFVSLCSFLAQPLLTAISFLQSRNLVQLVTLHMPFFFFSLLYGLVFLSDLSIRCWKLLFYY